MTDSTFSDFSADELAAFEKDFSDVHVAESYRVQAWRQLGATVFIPAGWPDFPLDQQTFWKESNMRKMTSAEVDAENDYNAAWRVRAREQDAKAMSLEALQRDLDERAAALTVAEAERVRLTAPPTPAEAAELDTKRVAAWVKHALGEEAFNDIISVPNEKFGHVLRTIPLAGWPSGDDASHLAALRTMTYPELQASARHVIDEPGEGGGLAALALP